MGEAIVKSATMIVPEILRMVKHGDSKLWIDYDKEVDVLYINFDKPQKADDSREDDDGIIRRMKKNKLIGVTVLHASRFSSRN